MVLLTEDGDVTRGEVKFLNSSNDVANYIEVLLEAGHAREKVRVFQGEEIGVEISYRPVVSLSAADTHTEAEGQDVLGIGVAQNGDVPVKETAGNDGPGMLNGVRLSELFRPS
jgi:hypothetical protein